MLVQGVLALCLVYQALAASTPGVNYAYNGGRRRCTVIAYGNRTDDVPNILKALHWCGNMGTIVFPEDQKYWIGQKLNLVGYDLRIEWKGQFFISDDIDYWHQPGSAFPIAYQNHAAGFVISGDKLDIDGYGTGGINGNGDVWYTAEGGKVQPGRPMPFVLWNVSDVTVRNFFVKDPALWAINIMNGTNMIFDKISVNATSTLQPYGGGWDANTVGVSTMDVNGLKLTNFVYQGGDDCIAIKPRSFNIYVDTVTCYAPSGPAIGSLGQYLEDSSVKNVQISNVKVFPNSGILKTPAYIKTWVGVPVFQTILPYESNDLPRGGGWGSVRNILFSNFTVENASQGPYITQDYGDDGKHSGSSLIDVSNVAFVGFSGSLAASATIAATVNCTKTSPCYNVDFKDLKLKGPNLSASSSSGNNKKYPAGKCTFVETSGVHGLQGC